MQSLGDNEHVLACIEALECEDYLYIVTPKACSEGTLCEAIAHGSIDPERAWKLFRKILTILLYLERHGIYHRDVSPDNFLFLSPDRLVIYDLALSVRLPQVQTMSSLRETTMQRTLIESKCNVGTLAYMDPAVFAGVGGPVDGIACDLWSATLILYNMLTGHILYRQPHPVDVNFRFFILARALSSGDQQSNPLVEQAMREIMQEVDGSGMALLDHSVVRLALAQRKIAAPALQVMDKIFRVNPADRWSLGQVIESDYVQHFPENES